MVPMPCPAHRVRCLPSAAAGPASRCSMSGSTAGCTVQLLVGYRAAHTAQRCGRAQCVLPGYAPVPLWRRCSWAWSCRGMHNAENDAAGADSCFVCEVCWSAQQRRGIPRDAGHPGSWSMPGVEPWSCNTQPVGPCAEPAPSPGGCWCRSALATDSVSHLLFALHTRQVHAAALRSSRPWQPERHRLGCQPSVPP